MTNNRILALYPNRDNHKSVCDAFKCEVTCVDNVMDAIKSLFANEYQIIYIDCAAVENKNADVLTTLRCVTMTPIVVVSSIHYREDNKTRTISNRCNAHIANEAPAKPCNKDKILSFCEALIIDPKRRQVLHNGVEVRLTKIEFDILIFLAEHKGQVMSRDQIFNNVWTFSFSFDVDEMVKSHIKRLRRKLEVANHASHNYIENVRGVGYRFVPPK